MRNICVDYERIHLMECSLYNFPRFSGNTYSRVAFASPERRKSFALLPSNPQLWTSTWYDFETFIFYRFQGCLTPPTSHYTNTSGSCPKTDMNIHTYCTSHPLLLVTYENDSHKSLRRGFYRNPATS